MTETINRNGLQFPAEPVHYDNFASIGSALPRVERRWQRITYMGRTLDLLFKGTCAACAYSTWWTPDEDVSLTDFIEQRYVHDRVITEDESGAPLEATFSMCTYCVGRERLHLGYANARSTPSDYARGLYADWPEEVVKQVTEPLAARKAAAERWLEVRAIVPTVGAFVLVNGDKFGHFDGFDAKGKVLVDGNPYDHHRVEAIIAVVYGTKHENVIVLPTVNNSRLSGKRGKIARYSNIHAVVSGDEIASTTIALNHLGISVPIINPATESPEDRADRLQWQMDRIRDAMHRRMVAEGTHRSWCTEFDPILDSMGLAPRQGKRRVIMTMEVEATGRITAEDLLDRGVWDHFSYSNVRCTAARIEEPAVNPMLSA
jgi:hypothetical protein